MVGNQIEVLKGIWRRGRLALLLAAVGVALALTLSSGHQNAQQSAADATTEAEFSIAVAACDTVGGGEAKKCVVRAGDSFTLDMSWDGFSGTHAGDAKNIQMVIHWTGAVSGPTVANGKSLTNAEPSGCDFALTLLEPGGDTSRAAIGCSSSSNIATGVMGTAQFNCDTVGQGTITLEHSIADTFATDAVLVEHWEDNALDTLTVNCDPDDSFRSMAKFQILVSPQFRGLMVDFEPPDYDGVSKLTSPRLVDQNTVVGHSLYHLDGDATDTGGASVGSTGTIISDSDFSLVPAFEGPSGSREVHTELRELDLVNGAIHVRAGTDAPLQPISPGEVESQSSSGDPALDFPADSFFDVFVEIELPEVGDFPGGMFYNQDPLLILNTVTVLPPKVVYRHGNTNAVPVFFRNDSSEWTANELFGWLTLAGHGASFDEESQDDIDEFEEIFEEEIETVPLPVPDSDGGGAPNDLEIAKGGDVDNPADDAAILALDNDQDGCTNGQELGTQEAAGGLRDPLNYWDFMDMWVNKQKDARVNIVDIGAIVNRIFTAGDPSADPLNPPQALTGYHVSADRSPPIGLNPWNAGPADGNINIIEIGLAVAQFLHDCN